ncbi:MAG: hypothetical protein WB392_11765, partial [Methanotrichaceae archaeon]
DPMLLLVSRSLDRQNHLEERLKCIESALLLPEGQKILSDLIKEGEIKKALKEILGSEVGIDTDDLGLVKDIIVSDRQANVDMRLAATYPTASYLGEGI